MKEELCIAIDQGDDFQMYLNKGGLCVGCFDPFDGTWVTLNLSEAKQVVEYIQKAIDSGELK